jgi:hypothetical protein
LRSFIICEDVERLTEERDEGGDLCHAVAVREAVFLHDICAPTYMYEMLCIVLTSEKDYSCIKP